MTTTYQLMSHFGGLCISDQTGLSRGLQIHFLFINNHVNIALMHVGQINQQCDSDSEKIELTLHSD